MFGNFTFGEGYFGEPEQVHGGAAVANAPSLSLSITLRQPAAIGSNPAGGGSGRWPKYARVIERVERSIAATAEVPSFSLSIKCRDVRAVGGASAEVGARKISGSFRPAIVSAGATVTAQQIVGLIDQRRPQVSAGACVQVVSTRHGQLDREEEDIAALLVLLT